jgi:hypothetical protein
MLPSADYNFAQCEVCLYFVQIILSPEDGCLLGCTTV